MGHTLPEEIHRVNNGTGGRADRMLSVKEVRKSWSLGSFSQGSLGGLQTLHARGGPQTLFCMSKGSLVRFSPSL